MLLGFCEHSSNWIQHVQENRYSHLTKVGHLFKRNSVVKFNYWYLLKIIYCSLNSEQQIVDCDTVSSGCNGGAYTTAWDYLMNNGVGVSTESGYPYVAVWYKWHSKWYIHTGIKLSSYENINFMITTVLKITQHWNVSISRYVPGKRSWCNWQPSSRFICLYFSSVPSCSYYEPRCYNTDLYPYLS